MGTSSKSSSWSGGARLIGRSAPGRPFGYEARTSWFGGESKVRFTRFGSNGGAVKPGVVAVAGRPWVVIARVWPGNSTGCVVGPLMVDSFSTSWIANPRTAAEAALAAHLAAF